MKVGKHTAFLIEFIEDFLEGELSRDHFEMDYSGYVIEHFPGMERENYRLSQKFASTIDATFENAQGLNISDEDFKVLMNNALCDFLGIDEPDLL